MVDEFRESLGSDADNYDVWCERCQRVHKHFTFTKEDYDRVMNDNVKTLTQAIDDWILAEVYAGLS